MIIKLIIMTNNKYNSIAKHKQRKDLPLITHTHTHHTHTPHTPHTQAPHTHTHLLYYITDYTTFIKALMVCHVTKKQVSIKGLI